MSEQSTEEPNASVAAIVIMGIVLACSIIVFSFKGVAVSVNLSDSRVSPQVLDNNFAMLSQAIGAIGERLKKLEKLNKDSKK